MISICITTFNREFMTQRSFAKVIDDPRVDDVVILDDASTDGSFQNLNEGFCGQFNVRVIGRLKNAGMSRAKFEAIGYAKHRFALILDSDNTIDPEYLDAFDGVCLDSKTIYMPEWARENFDYRAYSGLTFDKNNVKEYIDQPMFQTALNTANYVVPVDEYCKVYQEDQSVKETDTIHFAHLWLAAGNKFHVLKGLQYDHLVHKDSGWLQNASYNMTRAKQTVEQIKAL